MLRALSLMLLLATATAATIVKPRLPPTASVADISVDNKLMALRGGASLGPITPTAGAWLQVVLELYFLGLMSGALKLLPALPFMGGDPFAKYGWTEDSSSKPLQTQFCGAIGYLLSITFATTYWGDAAAHANVCKGSMFAWIVCGSVFFTQYFNGTCKFTEGNILCILLPFLFGYLGFA